MHVKQVSAAFIMHPRVYPFRVSLGGCILEQEVKEAAMERHEERMIKMRDNSFLSSVCLSVVDVIVLWVTRSGGRGFTPRNKMTAIN